MKNISVKNKLYGIYVITSILLMSVSYFSLTHEFDNLKQVSSSKEHTKVLKIITDLIYELQKERGLSAGYINVETKTFHKSQLKSQYLKTDKAKATYSLILKNKKNIQNILNPLLEIEKELDKIQIVRKKVQNLLLSFNDKMRYYSSINEKLIQVMKRISTSKLQANHELYSIVIIEELMEKAGIERASLYYQLLSTNDLMKNIRYLQNMQFYLKNNFLEFINEKSKKIYFDTYNKETEEKLNYYRNGVLDKSMNKQNAQECFQSSTDYINVHKRISDQIIKNYLQNIDKKYKKSYKAILGIIVIIFIIMAVAIIFLVIVILILNRDEKYKKELLIASYAFESQEAMAITDMDGDILRINKAFTKITGYAEDEIIGQNTNLLKSGKHDKEFYEQMWRMLLQQGKWQGEIYNKRKNAEIYPERLSITLIKDEHDRPVNFIAQFFDISEIKQTQELLQHQVDYDFLTTLLNREACMKRLQEEYAKAKRHRFLHAFLFIDLDEFKSVNDTYGHDIGDKVLQEVALRLKKCVREEDLVSRISGDEFALVLLNIGTRKSDTIIAVQKVCSKILQEISKEMEIDDYSLRISSSIGAKVFPDGEKDINETIKDADKAMYEAKRDGRDRYVLFDQPSRE